jgi:hypothetical protein
VVGEVCQHEQGHHPAEEGAQIKSASDGGFLSVKEALRQVIIAYVS